MEDLMNCDLEESRECYQVKRDNTVDENDGCNSQQLELKVAIDWAKFGKHLEEVEAKLKKTLEALEADLYKNILYLNIFEYLFIFSYFAQFYDVFIYSTVWSKLNYLFSICQKI